MPKKRAYGEGTILKRKDGSFEGSDIILCGIG